MSHRKRKSSSSRVGQRRRSDSGLSPAQISLRDFRKRLTARRRSADRGSFRDKVKSISLPASVPRAPERDPYPRKRVPAKRRRVPNLPRQRLQQPQKAPQAPRNKFLIFDRFIG